MAGFGSRPDYSKEARYRNSAVRDVVVNKSRFTGVGSEQTDGDSCFHRHRTATSVVLHDFGECLNYLPPPLLERLIETHR